MIKFGMYFNQSYLCSCSSSNEEDDNGREPVYTEDGEYESVTSSEDEKGKSQSHDTTHFNQSKMVFYVK